MELIWTLARHSPDAVLEANFRPHSSYERSRILELSDRVMEVNCVCPPALASRRYSARARSGQHHPAHVLPDLPENFAGEYDVPIGIGTVIQVDTTKPVDVRSLAREIARLKYVRLPTGQAWGRWFREEPREAERRGRPCIASVSIEPR